MKVSTLAKNMEQVLSSYNLGESEHRTNMGLDPMRRQAFARNAEIPQYEIDQIQQMLGVDVTGVRLTSFPVKEKPYRSPASYGVYIVLNDGTSLLYNHTPQIKSGVLVNRNTDPIDVDFQSDLLQAVDVDRKKVGIQFKPLGKGEVLSGTPRAEYWEEGMNQDRLTAAQCEFKDYILSKFGGLKPVISNFANKWPSTDPSFEVRYRQRLSDTDIFPMTTKETGKVRPHIRILQGFFYETRNVFGDGIQEEIKDLELSDAVEYFNEIEQRIMEVFNDNSQTGVSA